MDRSYAATFEDHYKFKCLIVFMDKDLKEKNAKDLKALFEEVICKKETLDLFMAKLGKDLREKLIPKYVVAASSRRRSCCP